jgi:hypothetical protein
MTASVFVNEDQVVQQVAALRATAGVWLAPIDSSKQATPLAAAILDAWDRVSEIQRPSLRGELRAQLRRLVHERYTPPPAELEKLTLETLQDEPIQVEEAPHERKPGRRTRRA